VAPRARPSASASAWTEINALGPGRPGERHAGRQRHEDVRLPRQDNIDAARAAQRLGQFAGEGQDEIGLGVIAAHGAGIDAAMARVEHQNGPRTGLPWRIGRLRHDAGGDAVGQARDLAEGGLPRRLQGKSDHRLARDVIGHHRRDPGSIGASSVRTMRDQPGSKAAPTSTPLMPGQVGEGGRHPVPEDLAEIDDDPPGIVPGRRRGTAPAG
jgi:hypothetical protein